MRIFLSSFLTISFSSYSQKGVKKTKLENVAGTAIGSSSESQEIVYNRAISNAKATALQEAGVEETIVSGADWYKYENEDNFEEMFASNILSDMRIVII